jgi:hypothetical protein
LFLPGIFVFIHLKIPKMTEKEILLARQIEILTHGLRASRTALIDIAFKLERCDPDFEICCKEWASSCRDAANREECIIAIPPSELIP